MGEEFRPASPERQRRRRRAIIAPALLAISLLVIVLWLGRAVLWKASEPYSEEPAMAFVVRDLYPQAQDGFRMDVLIRSPGGGAGGGECKNPVDVTAVVSGTPGLWKSGAPQLDRRADVAFSVAGAPASNLKFGVALTMNAPLYPEYALTSGSIDPSIKSGFRTDGNVAYGWIENWSSSRVPLVATFETNWTLDRTRGTCYVLLPNLTGGMGSTGAALVQAITKIYYGKNFDDVPPNQWNPDEISIIFGERDKRVAASYARVNLDANGDLVPEDSYPTPKVHGLGSKTNIYSHTSVWTCQSSKYELAPRDQQEGKPPKATAFAANEQFPGDSDCGGFAVISASPVEAFNTVALILVGLFLSLIAELGIEALRRRRILGP